MTDRYAVIGNPVAQSQSPQIHAAFARATGQDMSYTALLAPLDGFAETLRQFKAGGGKGANVTVPFKQQAYRLSTRTTERARLAEAVNTLKFDGPEILGDNTDGAGLIRDLTRNLGCAVACRQVLLMGAGGAAQGVLGPLLAEAPGALVIANRTADKARALAARFAPLGPVSACAYAELAGSQFDLVINATSAGLAGEVPPLPPGLFAAGALAYDMIYGDRETAFLGYARQAGASRFADGLGMLVEQAAEAFWLWRGITPDTAPLLAALRRC